MVFQMIISAMGKIKKGRGIRKVEVGVGAILDSVVRKDLTEEAAFEA